MGERTNNSYIHLVWGNTDVEALVHGQFSSIFPSTGPLPVSDSFGVRVAITMLLKSTDLGQYANYQQFESIRKLHTAYSNIFMASKEGSESYRTFGGDKHKYYLTKSPTQSQFFERFTLGCVHHMGQEVQQDWGYPYL
jgi:hypothetical protein